MLTQWKRITEPGNPVVAAALRFGKRRDRVWRLMTDGWAISPIGITLFLLLAEMLIQRWGSPGAPEMLVLGVLTVMLSAVLARRIGRLRLTSKEWAMERIADELRLPTRVLGDLLTSPVGTAEFLDALIHWRRADISRNAWLWAAMAIGVFALPVGGLLSPMVIYVMVQAVIRAAEPEVSSLAITCRMLKDMRCAVTGCPANSFSGGPTAEDRTIMDLGCMALLPVIVGGLIIVLLQILYQSAVQYSWMIGVAFCAMLVGFAHGSLLLSMRRKALSENRSACYWHLEAILDEVREHFTMKAGGVG